jgi:hypothetical protein
MSEAQLDQMIGDLLAKICSHEAINEAMQDSWNDICSDTGCHPLDIQQGNGKGQRLTFSPNHWANQVAKRLFVRALNLRLEMAPHPLHPAQEGNRPFYGAECPSYPNCAGGCGLGCTKQIERRRAASAECLKIAKIIWHRFATDSVEFWEDETHQAEYLDCANHILEDIAPQPATVAQGASMPKLADGLFYKTRGNEHNLPQIVGPLELTEDDEWPWLAIVCGQPWLWDATGRAGSVPVGEIGPHNRDLIENVTVTLSSTDRGGK